MRPTESIRLGFELGSGAPVDVPIRHMVVTGQTQEAGKTTALEAMIQRSGRRALAFVTKRGEGSFAGARIVPPYFREQADWQFVASILEASRGEKLKFERAWIIRASKGARTLADVQRNVRTALEKAKGLSADVYLTLDAYLEVVVPEIGRVEWAPRVALQPGVNAMDLSALTVEMQHLVIRSSIRWVLEQEEKTLVVVPEAWKFIPQGRGTPVKLAAEEFIRQAAALGNYLWLDSQDIAGVDKTILKSVPVWVLGVQRETNEVKRTLAQIPGGVKKPDADAIATLGLGEFYVCHGREIAKVYAQPLWMNEATARAVALGHAAAPEKPPHPKQEDNNVTKHEAQQLEAANENLRKKIADLERRLEAAQGTATKVDKGHAPAAAPTDLDAIYQHVRDRLSTDAPHLLEVLNVKPEIRVQVTRERIEASNGTLLGRLAILVAEGFFDAGATASAAWSELNSRGGGSAKPNVYRECDNLTTLGFLRKEPQGSNVVYRAVSGMKVQIDEAREAPARKRA